VKGDIIRGFVKFGRIDPWFITHRNHPFYRKDAIVFLDLY